MVIRTHYEHGQFAWDDLTARDMVAARQFYGKLLGWECVDVELPSGPPYAYFQLDGKAVAGLGQMNDAMLAKKLPAAWNSYIYVDDVQAACQQAVRLGGEVTVPVRQISEVGTLAFIRDPTGAQVGLWQKGTHFGADVTQDYHCSCWHELLTRDIETARTFYSQLFDWEFSDYKSSWSKYYVIRLGEEESSGMLQMDERWGDMPPRWMPYFAVRSVDITVDQVRQLGGFVQVHPYDIPEGRFAMVGDAQGAALDLVEMSETAEETE